MGAGHDKVLISPRPVQHGCDASRVDEKQLPHRSIVHQALKRAAFVKQTAQV